MPFTRLLVYSVFSISLFFSIISTDFFQLSLLQEVNALVYKPPNSPGNPTSEALCKMMVPRPVNLLIWMIVLRMDIRLKIMFVFKILGSFNMLLVARYV